MSWFKKKKAVPPPPLLTTQQVYLLEHDLDLVPVGRHDGPDDRCLMCQWHQRGIKLPASAVNIIRAGGGYHGPPPRGNGGVGVQR